MTRIIVKSVTINAYLVPAPNVIVGQLSSRSSDIDDMTFGNMPNDGGYLLLSREASNNRRLTMTCKANLFVASSVRTSLSTASSGDAFGLRTSRLTKLR